MIDLPHLLEAFGRTLPTLAGGPVRPLLVRARLADAWRTYGHSPPVPEVIDEQCATLDDQAWRRLALFVSTLDDEHVLDEIGDAADDDDDVVELTRVGFIGLAADASLHTIDLLTKSAHRREELARKWLLHLAVEIADETPEESISKLERLDYARLLNDVNAAKAAAEERAAYVLRLQQKADERAHPRGKF